ncbi:MAG: aspartate aminotransferase family protein [Gammaproteobacteria bacterium]
MSDADSAVELDRFERLTASAMSALRKHIEDTSRGTAPATGYAPLREVHDALEVERWLPAGGMDEATFAAFMTRYLKYSVKLHHPAYIAHQVGIPDYPGALAAMINGVVNNPMAIYEMGPSAAMLEFVVLNWMLEKVGWTPQPFPDAADGTPHSAGVLTHGGSLANLTALLAARARVAPDAWERGTPHDLAVLAPRNSHYSVARAVSILGLGSDAVYPIDVTRFGVVRPEALAPTLDKVIADGRRPMAIIGNACSTATGLHDPLVAMGEFCARHDVWFHVDACHGATALLAKDARRYLEGIELGDSIVWDAHKMMQVPALCAALLLKDGADFDRAFHQEASYLAYGHDRDGYDSLPRAVECTKASLSFKIFLTLAFRGEQALGDYVDDRYAMAHTARDIIVQRPGFTCPYTPESNILCFRYGDDDALQVQIRDALVRERSFHLTSAEVDGKNYLRITIMNKHTDTSTIEAMLDAVERKAGELTTADPAAR